MSESNGTALDEAPAEVQAELAAEANDEPEGDTKEAESPPADDTKSLPNADIAFATVVKLNVDCMQALAEYEEAKEEAKSRKDRWEYLCKKLHETIAAGAEKLPLFEPKEQAASPEDAAREAALATTLEDVFTQADPPLSEAIAAKFRAKGINTVGDLAKWTAAPIFDGADNTNRLTDIEGIGPAKAEKVEWVLEQFWERQKRARENGQQPAEAAEIVEDMAEATTE